MGSEIERAKFETVEALCWLCSSPKQLLQERVQSIWSRDALIQLAHPINELSVDALVAGWWARLREALPDVARREMIVLAEECAGVMLVGVCGHYEGTFSAPLVGIPPTHGLVMLRYGELHEVMGGKIRRSWMLPDFVDLMRQAGCSPLATSLGAEQTWPAPADQSGLRRHTPTAAEGRRSLEVVRAMHGSLMDFDGTSLESMPLEKYWTENFMWYGPGGIGSSRGLQGFRMHHQIPFLRAFPDRRGGHSLYIGDGPYVMNCGWPAMVGTHTGGDWLGLSPSGRRVTMRVMDFYRLEGGVIAENWVPIDVLDMLEQLGVRPLERMRHKLGDPRRVL